MNLFSMTQTHILNGDALKERFPKQIQGQTIVIRECLIEGEVSGNSMGEFYRTRSDYLSKAYPGESDYFESVVPELESILTLPKTIPLYLWFEDDLFCQTNFWFICSLLFEKEQENAFLVRPGNNSLQYGFGGLSEEQLIQAFKKSTLLSQNDLEYFGELWAAYRTRNSGKLKNLSDSIPPKFNFLPEAIEAAIGVVENNEPRILIQKIMTELDELSFPGTFREFHKRYPIFGFGDLQVKRIFDEINSTN